MDFNTLQEIRRSIILLNVLFNLQIQMILENSKL